MPLLSSRAPALSPSTIRGGGPDKQAAVHTSHGVNLNQEEQDRFVRDYALREIPVNYTGDGALFNQLAREVKLSKN